MTQDQPSRLDRIEAAIETDRIASREWFERIQQWYDNERAIMADMRTRQEIQSNQIEAQSLQISELRTTAELLLQTVQLHQDNINIIAQSVRQHRSDGHGS